MISERVNDLIVTKANQFYEEGELPLKGKKESMNLFSVSQEMYVN